MGIAKILNNVFEINSRAIDDYNVYLIQISEGYFVLIDAGNGTAINYIINNIMSILNSKDKLKYLVLLSNDEREIGGAFAIYNIFTPLVVAHTSYAHMIRAGKGLNGETKPLPVNMEVNGEVSRVGEVTLRLVRGQKFYQLIAKVGNIIFTGSITSISPISKKISCNIEACIKG